MVYLWKIPDDWPEELIGKYVRSESIDRFELTQGTSIAPNSPVVLSFDVPKSNLTCLDDLPNTSMVPVVNSRIADVLWSCASEDCQLLSTRVETSDGVISGFWTVVATKKLPIMDLRRSVFSVIPGTESVMGIQNLVCNKDPLCNAQMARDIQYLPNLFISDELYSAIAGFEPRGIGFYIVPQM